MNVTRRVTAEALGTGFLLAVIVGSGIMGERLAGGNVALALLANAAATGAGLFVLILMLGPVSGAQLNPGSASTHVRAGAGQWFAEAVATFGLLLAITLVQRTRPAAVAAAVGAYIFAAYWFTASTSFANSAVTLARTGTDTFTGIRLQDTPGFLAAQIVGAVAAIPVSKWMRS